MRASPLLGRTGSAFTRSGIDLGEILCVQKKHQVMNEYGILPHAEVQCRKPEIARLVEARIR